MIHSRNGRYDGSDTYDLLSALRTQMTTGRNLWACRWNPEGNTEYKDFTRKLTLDAGLI